MSAITTNQPSAAPVTAKSRYATLSTFRDPALVRAREVSKLTIPALVPEEGATDATKLTTPYQSVGARGTNNLAAKLLLSLFPPGTSFFRLTVDEFALDKLKARAEMAGEGDPISKIEKALAKVEKALNTRLEQKAARPVLSEMFKHLIVAGNALLQVMKDGKLKLHTLANYVTKRDAAGEPVEIIVRETLSRRTLPRHVHDFVASKANGTEDEKEGKDQIDLYTWVRRVSDGSWKQHQEILDLKIPGTDGTFPKDKTAWLPLRWQSVAGNDYGRGHGEEYLGDLYSLEALSQSIVEFAGNAAKIVWLVQRGGTTDKNKLAKAPSGAVIDGNAKDVSGLMMEKFADFQVVKATAADIEQRLEQAFLLNSSVQRQAERVTAEEIRFMAGELEQSLGGTYSVLAQELQLPLIARLMSVMQKAGQLPHLPEQMVKPQIVTGLDGLGRSSDFLKLELLVKDLAATFGPEASAEYINVGAYASRRAAALGIDTEGVIRSEEDVQASRQQQQQAAMMEKLAPTGVKVMSDHALAGKEQQNTTAPQAGA